MNRASVPDRALVLAPRGRDAAIAVAILGEAGFAAEACASVPALVDALDEEAAFVVATEEALAGADLAPLAAWLAGQEEWSDLPFVLLTGQGGGVERNPAARRYLELLGNAAFLERPFHPTTLVSLARSSLRARRRQYEARARLEALRREDERLQFALEAGRMGAWDYDFATGALSASGACKALFGLPPDADVTYRVFLGAIHPEDRAAQAEAVRRAVRSRADYDAEHRIIRPDTGETRWLAFRGRPTRAEDGRPLRIAGVSFDVTERRRAEEALRESEAFARSITDVAPSIIYLYDFRAKRNVWGNRDMVAVLGYGRDEIAAMAGGLVETLIHPDDLRAYRDHVARLVALPDGEAAEFEYRFRRSDGSWVWLMSRDMIFRRDAEGAPEQIIGAALDITSLKETEGALARLNAELEARVAAAVAEREAAFGQLHEAQKTEALGQLTGGVAHDFNNLLFAILANLDLARDRSPDPRVRKLLDGAITAAERGAALTRRLLAFARRQELKAEAVDLRRLVEGMDELVRHSVGPGVVVSVDLPEGLPPVMVDANQLELALLNLAVNGRDAMPSGGALTVSARIETVVGDGAARGLAP